MQIEHMEVNLPGTNQRQSIGPLFSGLNAITGPRGSGKTRLVHWLRQITAENNGSQYIPDLSFTGLTGCVDLRNQGRWLRLTQDRQGHIVAERLSYPANANGRSTSSQSPIRNMANDVRYVSPTHSSLDHNASVALELTARQRQAFDLLAAASETSDTQAALDDAAIRLGLDINNFETQGSQRDRLVIQESDLIARLARSEHLPGTRDELLGRRRDIEHRLNGLKQRADYWEAGGRLLDRSRLVDRYAAIEADLRGALAEVEQCDGELAEIKAQLKLSELDQQTAQIEPGYRMQLQQLEDRLSRWRQTLRDIKLHRESIDHDRTDADLDQQVGTQLSSSPHPDPRAAMRSLEAQIHNARKQLDHLVHQYGTSQPGIHNNDRHASSVGYQVRCDGLGHTHIQSESQPAVCYEPQLLPPMLRSMQRDLHEICHHFSQHESHAAAEALKYQARQLRRCETELLQSVELLIQERGALLRKIADRYNLTSDQLSLAFGDWCQCHDHLHLHDWLFQDEAAAKSTNTIDGQPRSQLLDTLSRLEAQRKSAALRAEECRRQLREAEQSRLPVHAKATEGQQAEEAKLLHELDTLQAALIDLDNCDRLRAELNELRHQLSRLPSTTQSASDYRQAVNRHIIGLSGSLYQRDYHEQADFVASRHYDTINGIVVEHPSHRRQYQVPDAIVRTAQRLAIAQSLAVRGDAIPVLLDQTLDGLEAELQRAAVDYLARIGQRQQIVVLTEDRRIVDLVRQHRGRIHSLSAPAVAPQLDHDVNRFLSGQANVEEASMWHQSSAAPSAAQPVGHNYLSEHSLIEEHPTLNSTLAAGCQELGVHSIGDLMDVDALWLAKNLQISKITEVNVSNWQAVAGLLCSVRNLRPFDARVLVGAGIRNAAMLSQMHPTKLAERVERFLRTDIGRKILRSGNSFELSRITDWIAAAKNGTAGNKRSGYRDVMTGRSSSNAGRGNSGRGSSGRGSADYVETDFRDRSVRSAEYHGGEWLHGASATGNGARGGKRTVASDVYSNGHSAERRSTDATKRSHGRSADNGSSRSLRYYLELASPVADAPSIGNRMAERLKAMGVITVDQLLKSNPETLAERMEHARVTSDTVRTWQEQARLVCRIPNLRGHDAQMLVACNLMSPEVLATMNPDSVLSQVLAYSRTAEGQRVLRGSPEPDLAEVKNWLAWAAQSRNLNAA